MVVVVVAQPSYTSPALSHYEVICMTSGSGGAGRCTVGGLTHHPLYIPRSLATWYHGRDGIWALAE